MLYVDYKYKSSTSNVMKNHLEQNCIYFCKKLKLNPTDAILEIGCNDGTCINFLLKNNYQNVTGVDPAKNIVEKSNLPIICDFFGKNILNKLKKNSYKLIFAFHCCAHIENIDDVFSTIFELLDDDGMFIFEVGYFLDLYEKRFFDTIYHEHIDYHTVTSMERYALHNKLKLVKVKRTNIQGGSIQFYLSKDLNHELDISIKQTKKLEQKLSYNNLLNWSKDINQKIVKLNDFIISKNYKKIIGYGCPAKLTTFLFQIDFPIEYIIEDNIEKVGLYTPGKNIPICDFKTLESENSDNLCIIIFAWNMYDEIIKKINKTCDVITFTPYIKEININNKNKNKNE